MSPLRWGHDLRLEYLLASQRPLQRRLHLHLAELSDGEVKVLQGVLLLSRVMVQEQLGELKAGQGQLRAQPHLGADPDRFLVMLAGFVVSAKEGRRPTEVAGNDRCPQVHACRRQRVAGKPLEQQFRRLAVLHQYG